MIAIPVHEQSQVAQVRQEGVLAAGRQAFTETDRGRVAIVATELATNVLKHGGGGEVLVGPYEDADGSGVEIIALDQGTGMANVAACFVDGFSTAGSAGEGLGAARRQSHILEIASWPKLGTAVLARLRAGNPCGEQGQPSQVGAVAVPMPGQEVCGDSWSAADEAVGPTLMVADGLGHGPDAAEASVEAVRLFRRFGGHQVPTLLDYVHGGLRATRGAAVSIARLDRTARKIIFSGVGNVSGVIASAGAAQRRMVSMAGTAGHNARKIRPFDYPFEAGLVILHSDGVSSNWTLDRYPTIANRHPTLIAAVLYRDHSRKRDDATVLVAKW